MWIGFHRVSAHRVYIGSSDVRVFFTFSARKGVCFKSQDESPFKGVPRLWYPAVLWLVPPTCVSGLFRFCLAQWEEVLRQKKCFFFLNKNSIDPTSHGCSGGNRYFKVHSHTRAAAAATCHTLVHTSLLHWTYAQAWIHPFTPQPLPVAVFQFSATSD